MISARGGWWKPARLLALAGGVAPLALGLLVAGCGGTSSEVKTPATGDPRAQMSPEERANYEATMKGQRGGGPGGGGGAPGGVVPR